MTKTASKVLKYQRLQKQKVLFSGKVAEEQYQDLVFVTKTNKPTQQFLIKQCISCHVTDDTLYEEMQKMEKVV